MRLVGRHPVVVRAGLVALRSADEGEMLDPRDVVGIGAVQVTIWVGVRVQADQIAVFEHQFDQTPVFFVGAVTPVDPIGFSLRGNVFYPIGQFSIFCHYSTPDRPDLQPYVIIATLGGRLLCIRGSALLNSRVLGNQARVTNAALFVDGKVSRFANSSSGSRRATSARL